MARLEAQLLGVGRCPHCAVASPVLERQWQSEHRLPRATPGPTHRWAAYACTSCGDMVLAKGSPNDTSTSSTIVEVIPAAKSAHVDIPEPARTFLQQAYETLHAPDAAAVMAGSAVDGMLKVMGYVEGTLYSRIDKAVVDHKITQGMGDWAHEVRLGSNRPRHADKDLPHLTSDEAKQSVDFAEAFGYFVFVLAKRIEKGVQAAKASPP